MRTRSLIFSGLLSIALFLTGCVVQISPLTPPSPVVAPANSPEVTTIATLEATLEVECNNQAEASGLIWHVKNLTNEPVGFWVHLTVEPEIKGEQIYGGILPAGLERTGHDPRGIGIGNYTVTDESGQDEIYVLEFNTPEYVCP